MEEGGYEQPRSAPRVLLVGGPDVRARGDLMKVLEGSFEVSAAGSEPEDAQHLAQLGLSFHYYPMSRGSTPASDLHTCLALFRIIRRLRPDIVHTFATKPCVWGRIAARLAGVPIVIGTVPGLGSLYCANDLRRRTLKRIYEALQRSASRMSDLTLFQNERDAGQLTETGVVPVNRSMVIPGSGVRTDVFDRTRVSGESVKRLRSDVGLSEREVLVTMVSRVIRTKGVLIFAEAANLVRKETRNVRFLLVGPDDQNSMDRLSRQELERISSAVDWLGERSDVLEILAATDVFTLPTFYREGIPRVLLEAASMSLPLVATMRPGCDEVVIEGNNGFLIPPKDPVALAQAILKLASSPDLRRRFAEKSRQIAIQKFDLAVIGRRTADLYQELLATRGKRRLVNGAREPGKGRPSVGGSARVRHRPPTASSSAGSHTSI